MHVFPLAAMTATLFLPFAAQSQHTDTTRTSNWEAGINATLMAQPGSSTATALGLLVKKRAFSDYYFRAGFFTVPEVNGLINQSSSFFNNLTNEGYVNPYHDPRIRYFSSTQYYQTTNLFKDTYAAFYTGMEKKKKLTPIITQYLGMDLGFGQIRSVESTLETLVSDSTISQPPNGTRPPLNQYHISSGTLIYQVSSVSQVLTCSAFYGLQFKLNHHLAVAAQVGITNDFMVTSVTATDEETGIVTPSADIYHFNSLLNGTAGIMYIF